MTVIDRIRANLASHADLPALVEGGRSWTHAELFDRVDCLSNALTAAGIRKGDVLLCWLGNQHEALETELACLQIGAIWVTLNANLTWPEVASVLLSTRPKVLVSKRELLDRVKAADGETVRALSETILFRVGMAVSECEDEFRHVMLFEHSIADADARRPTVSIDPMDVARLRYTSGTTGRAKAAILSHRAYVGSLDNQTEHLHALSPSDRVLHAAPLTHASAALAYPILEAGGANVILPAFDAAEVLSTIEAEAITTMFAVPTMLGRLIAAPEFGSRDLSSLRTISYGGAPMPVEGIEPLIDALGPVLMQIYGLTEALHPVTCLKREEHFAGNPKLGSAGTLTSSCQIEIRSEDGTVCGVDSIGEIFVQGPITFSGYWNDPDATAKTLQNGWVATGDLGYRDADDYYWIAGRKKNVIISGGFNVYAKEVEMVLLAYPGIDEAAVIGIPDADWGERVTAVVWSESGAELDPDALIQYCRGRLAAYKTPKSVAISDAPLPKNSAGKIARDALRAILAAQQAPVEPEK